jgi:hypothetical protein
MVQRSRFKWLLFVVWGAFIALACTLSSSSDTATIAPRPTQTPPPTIGYATLSPQELPQEAALVAQVPEQEAAIAAPVEAMLVNLTNQVQTDQLIFHVDTLQNFGTRHVNSSYTDPNRGIGAAYNYIVGQFERIREQSQGRLVVFSHPFELTWGDVTSTAQNVVAFLNGTEPGAGTIIISAHYDSISLDVESGTALAPGANDNGSGVAAMLELARILSTRQHRASIMFVAVSAEEVGRVGSQAFVAEYLAPREIDIAAVINLDIIGSYMGENGIMDDRHMRLFSNGPNDDSNSRHLARTVELIAVNHVPFMTLRIEDAADRDGRYGDQMSFHEAGYPAVRFIQAVEERSRQHTERDTVDAMQGSYLARATQTVLTIVTALADGPRPPATISMREDGGGLRTLVWSPVPGASGYIIALRRPGSLFFEQFAIDDPASNSITWDGFTPDRFVEVAIAAKDGDGLMGPLSDPYPIR